MRADLAIVGAGTAGAALAALAAEAGISVVCLERRRLSEAGARWVNGVPGWAFDEAGIERSSGSELRGAGHTFHLLAGWGPKGLALPDHELLEVDMRMLVERLQARAQSAGARLVGETRVTAIEGRRLHTTAGPVDAHWVVDASGFAGARLLDQPRVSASDLCAAAQEVRTVTDLPAAREFFERHAVRPGETLCFTGVAGGFSVVNVRLDSEGVSILTGSIPGDGHVSGVELLARFVADHPWVGDVIFGGARAIPLRRPLDRLVQGNVALIGDAACQVFSAHGSGIGAGLVAARMLTDVLSTGRPLHAYATEWQRRFGGLFAAYDAFRRFSQRLGPRELERMLDSGLLDVDSALAGLGQRLPRLKPTQVRRALRGVLAERRIAFDLTKTLVRTGAALAHYARYPDEPAALPSWSRRAAWLLDR